MKQTFKKQLRRTLNIIGELAMGRHLILPTGYRIGMSKDMAIGYLHGSDDIGWRISGVSLLSFKDLNKICNKHDITDTIPEIWVDEPDDGYITEFEVVDNG